jgi:hypothetical protein
VSFAVGSVISFVISTRQQTALECRGVVTQDHQNPGGGFETAATIDSIRILPLETRSSKEDHYET